MNVDHFGLLYFHNIVIVTARVCCYQVNTRGTVRDKTDFKVEEDVSALRKATEGIGKLNESIHFIYLAHF